MYHKVIVAGYLGRDPEMRYLPNGMPVTNFSVAANRRWVSQDGEAQEETIWFRVAAFGRLAEVCSQYLSKGRAVLIEGRLRPGEDGNPRTWTGQDGTVRASFEIVAETVRFLGGGNSRAVESDEPELVDDEEDDIPF